METPIETKPYSFSVCVEKIYRRDKNGVFRFRFYCLNFSKKIGCADLGKQTVSSSYYLSRISWLYSFFTSNDLKEKDIVKIYSKI